MQKEKTDFTDVLNQRRIALNNSQKALEKETIARAAMVSAFNSIQRQVSDLKTQNVSFKELNQELKQSALSAPHEHTCKIAR